MGRHKDESIANEEGREAAARAKGRICQRCGVVPVDFDDIGATSHRMICSSCRKIMDFSSQPPRRSGSPQSSPPHRRAG